MSGKNTVAESGNILYSFTVELFKIGVFVVEGGKITLVLPLSTENLRTDSRKSREKLTARNNVDADLLFIGNAINCLTGESF